MLLISDIWLSHRKLRNPAQLCGMIENLEALPPIILARCEDGELQLEDGHHRLTAYWLSGRDHLYPYEYVLLEKDQWRPRKGKIDGR